MHPSHLAKHATKPPITSSTPPTSVNPVLSPSVSTVHPSSNVQSAGKSQITSSIPPLTYANLVTLTNVSTVSPPLLVPHATK